MVMEGKKDKRERERGEGDGDEGSLKQRQRRNGRASECRRDQLVQFASFAPRANQSAGARGVAGKSLAPSHVAVAARCHWLGSLVFPPSPFTASRTPRHSRTPPRRCGAQEWKHREPPLGHCTDKPGSLDLHHQTHWTLESRHRSTCAV